MCVLTSQSKISIEITPTTGPDRNHGCINWLELIRGSFAEMGHDAKGLKRREPVLDAVLVLLSFCLFLLFIFVFFFSFKMYKAAKLYRKCCHVKSVVSNPFYQTEHQTLVWVWTVHSASALLFVFLTLKCSASCSSKCTGLCSCQWDIHLNIEHYKLRTCASTYHFNTTDTKQVLERTTMDKSSSGQIQHCM